MRLKPLLEDVKHDQQFLAKANEFYRDLIKIVDEEEKIYANAGSINSGKLKGTIYFRANIISPKYEKELIIGLTPERLAPTGDKPEPGKMGGRFAGSTSGKDVWLILPVLKEDYSLEGALDVLASIKSSVVHEFTHYLDYKRFKGGPEAYRSYAQKEREPGEFGTSGSHPQEFNAYYQAAVNRYADELQKAYVQKSHKVDELLPDDVRQFMKMIKDKFFRKGFLGDLTPQFMRKLDKRLVKLYQHLKGE